MPLIPADKARDQTASFGLSQDQIIEDISLSIDANSKAGKRVIVVQYLTSAVSQQELDGVLAAVRSKGYNAEIIKNDFDKENHTIRINW